MRSTCAFCPSSRSSNFCSDDSQVPIYKDSQPPPLLPQQKKKSPFIFTLLTLLRGNQWVFCIRLVKCFSSNFHHHSISILPSFHPPSTYIHSFIIIISHKLFVNSLTFLIKPCHFVILFVVITFPRLSFFREKKRQNYKCLGHLSICLCFFYVCQFVCEKNEFVYCNLNFSQLALT